MKKILVVCRRDEREDYDQSRTMLRGLTPLQGEITYAVADYEDLLFTYDGVRLRVTDTVSGTDIADYDALFLIGWFKSKPLDDIARAVAHYAKAHGVAFANSEAYYGRSFTKLSQCVIAALNGVTVTKFIFSLDPQVLLQASKAQAPAFPYIAKAVAASRGHDNHLITSYEQLKAVVLEESDKPKHFIVQEFVPNDGDYRILVMGGQVRLVIHRQAQPGSHLNNTSQGGTASLLETKTLPPKVITDAIQLSQLFRREVTGVDMVCDRQTGQFYFLEANNMPQLATGRFVPEKLQALTEYLAELAEGNGLRYID